MTDKELNQIDFWLSGQKRYKLLDCSRRAFLKLKGARLQVWLAHYTSERDSQQSWLSLEWLMADTGCSKPTVIAARRWLVKHGWIRVLEGSAADMYENPTQGAHKVRIMCVDDPTNGVGGKETLLGEGVKKLDVKELGKETLPNVSAVAFAFASASALAVASGIEATSTHATTCMTCSPSEEPSLREDEKQKQKQQQQPSRSSSATKWLATYGSPMPEGFNTWSQESRTAWCLEQKEKMGKPQVVAPPVEEKAKLPAPAQMKASVAETAPKVSVLSATPTPPSSAPPPKPAEPVDYRLGWMKRLAEDIYTLQIAFNPNVKPPSDWDTAWLPDSDALVKLTEANCSMHGWMLDDVIALSQVRYAAKYTTPAPILADVLPLGREVAELRIRGTFAEVRDAYYEVFHPPEHIDELDDKPTMWIDPEVKAERERKELAKLIMRWNTWLDAHTPQEKIA